MHGSLRQSTSWIVVTLSASYLLLRFKANRVLEQSVFKDQANAEAVSNVLLAIAVGLFVAGVGMSMTQWQNTRFANQNAAHLVATANHSSNPLKPTATSSSVPSTTVIPAATLASYTVAPNAPRYLTIPRLNVHARILSVGVNTKGELETPNNVFDTAWYNGSSLPGQPGAMLIDGHISSWTAHGVFYGLNQLRSGDIIQVTRGDGTIFNYQVVRTQVYDVNSVDMNAALSPVDSSTPGLNLISCSGSVSPGTSEFNKRIVVFASQM